MILLTDIQQHHNIPFEHYLKMPGYSTSFLKKEKNGVAADFVKTDKIKVGSLVDSILTEPHKVNMSDKLYPFARDIAFKIKETFGDMFKQMHAQVSFTGTAEHKGFKMPIRGRLDFLLPKLAVIDLKVTYAKNLEDLIKFMRYKEQVYLYSKFAGVTKAYLFIYCVPLKTCTVHFIDCSGHNDWWSEKIINFGTFNEQQPEQAPEHPEPGQAQKKSAIQPNLNF